MRTRRSHSAAAASASRSSGAVNAGIGSGCSQYHETVSVRTKRSHSAAAASAPRSSGAVNASGSWRRNNTRPCAGWQYLNRLLAVTACSFSTLRTGPYTHMHTRNAAWRSITLRTSKSAYVCDIAGTATMSHA